jgi:hypothetical protein
LKEVYFKINNWKIKFLLLPLDTIRRNYGFKATS